MKFSEKLINLRKMNGISQEELAGKLNVTRQTISKWELDQTSPDLNKLIDISKVFNISLDELVYGTEKADNVDEYKESSVEKNNKKIAVKVLIVGLVISIIIAGIGFFRQKQAENSNKNAYEEAYKLSESRYNEAQEQIKELTEKLNNVKNEISNKEVEAKNLMSEQTKIFSEDMGFSDRYNAKSAEYNKKQSELSNLRDERANLEAQIKKLEYGNYSVSYTVVAPSKYNIFYYVGAGVAGVTVLTSLIYFLVTRRKK